MGSAAVGSATVRARARASAHAGDLPKAPLRWLSRPPLRWLRPTPLATPPLRWLPPPAHMHLCTCRCSRCAIAARRRVATRPSPWASLPTALGRRRRCPSRRRARGRSSRTSAARTRREGARRSTRRRGRRWRRHTTRRGWGTRWTPRTLSRAAAASASSWWPRTDRPRPTCCTSTSSRRRPSPPPPHSLFTLHASPSPPRSPPQAIPSPPSSLLPLLSPEDGQLFRYYASPFRHAQQAQPHIDKGRLAAAAAAPLLAHRETRRPPPPTLRRAHSSWVGEGELCVPRERFLACCATLGIATPQVARAAYAQARRAPRPRP